MKRKNTDKAYSLLELLISLTLSGAVMWISLPEIRDVLVKKELYQIAMSVEQLIEKIVVRSREEDISYSIALKQKQIIVREEFYGNQVERLLLPVGVDFIPRKKPIYLTRGNTISPARVGMTNNKYYCEIIISLRGRLRRECHLED